MMYSLRKFTGRTVPDGEPAVRCPLMHVADRITGESANLTPAERRIAEVVLQDPQLVAFGTVAELAARARAGAATVVRFANKVGFEGFTGLQAAVQHELGQRLRPAAERIRQASPTDALGRTVAIEIDNVSETLASVDRAAFDRAVGVLTDSHRDVAVVSGDASRGVALQFANELSALRAGVVFLDGNQVALFRALALLEPGDVVVAVDLRRYDQWVVDLIDRAVGRGATVVAFSDSLLSPIASQAQAAFAVSAGGAGPFDSHVGTLALFNAIITACAGQLRQSATQRLDRLERLWHDVGALSEG
jgi:DNA-binding MurR/RpiR family transcriptional regulator